MAISLVDCKAIVEELQGVIVGGWIQKIHQPQPYTLTLEVRVPRDTFVLLVCTEPQFARLHLASKKSENPPTPPPYCQFLRAQIEGGRIEQIIQEPEDRIVYITIRTSASCFVLVAALTGKQANVFLLTKEQRILKSLKPTRMKPGETYLPPTQRKHVHSPSPSPLPQGGEEEELKGGEFAKRFPVSAILEERFSKLEAETYSVQLARRRIGQVQKVIKKGIARVRALEHDLEKAERYREYKRYGELLKGNLHQLARGQDLATVIDYYDPALPELVIPLDSSRDPTWNMEDYFRKYRKYLSAQEHLRPRLEMALNGVERLKEELEHLKKNEFEELVGIVNDAKVVSNASAAPHLLSSSPRGGKETRTRASSSQARYENSEKRDMKDQKKQTKGRAKPYREFESFDGIPIWVGKNAKDNDALTLKVAKPDDLWLHARGTPGSHVVVRIDKGIQVPQETLRDAAALALWYSDLRKSGKGEVIYTYRKFVKKGKGLKAGAVMVEREKSVWIEVKADRLERLKGTTG